MTARARSTLPRLHVQDFRITSTQTAARTQLSRGQVRWMIIVLLLAIAGLWAGFSLMDYLIGVIALITIAYLANVLFTIFVISRGSTETSVCLKTQAKALEWATLPTYSVLVPLFKEVSVLDQLIHNLCQLRYPLGKLRIMLLVEEDDTDLSLALRIKQLPPQFEVLRIPHSLPKTKPKALNVGLSWVESDLVTVYDAEDQPDPMQLLKAVAAFRNADSSVVCVQAALEYHNPKQNLLTRFFASEYAVWFRLFIPGLSRARLLFVLGGTSNHFKTSALRELGGWDPYNVTEDADLGIRIARAGYRIIAIDSVTYEEANSDPWNWVRQRSRWIKGYMQTYLVHMRNPVRLLRELGIGKFITFQLMVGFAPLANLLNPVFWIMTLVYLLTGSDFIESLFPTTIFYIGAVCLFVGNVITIYVKMNGALLQGEYASIKWMLAAHGYWLLMCIAAWRAVFQLIFRPHFWEKTVHGLHLRKS